MADEHRFISEDFTVRDWKDHVNWCIEGFPPEKIEQLEHFISQLSTKQTRALVLEDIETLNQAPDPVFCLNFFTFMYGRMFPSYLESLVGESILGKYPKNYILRVERWLYDLTDEQMDGLKEIYHGYNRHTG